MDNKKVVPIVIGVVVVGGLLLLLNSQSSATSTNPSQDVGYLTTLANDKTQLGLAQINARAALGGAGLQYKTALSNNAAGVKVAQLQGASADTLGKLQYETAAVAAQANTYATQVQGQVALDTNAKALQLANTVGWYGEQIAGINQQGNVQTTAIAANAAQNIATTQGNAYTSAADAQAHASQQNGLWGAIGNIVGGITKFLPFNFGGQTAVSNTVSAPGIGDNTATAGYF